MSGFRNFCANISLIMFLDNRISRTTIFAIVVACLMVGAADAKSKKKKHKPAPGNFAYYLLSLSFAPDFCDQPQGDKDPRECGVGRRVGFVVHGLWPQGESSRGPENCAGPTSLPQPVVTAALKYIPTEKLIQHEWTSHGTCSGLKPAEYFTLLSKARDSVKIPSDLDQPQQQAHLTSSQIESKLAVANPSFPLTSFRVSCYPDNELKELRICLNKDLTPRACSASAGECSIPSITILPVR